MLRFTRVRGADPDLLLAAAIVWLMAIPSLGLLAAIAVYPLGAFADCFEHCQPRPTLVDVVGQPALALAAIAVGLLAVVVVARLRPRLGYWLAALAGIAILAWICLVIVANRDPAALVLLAWPGWSGIALINAAWRASRSPVGA